MKNAQVTLYHNLSVLLDSGVPILRALETAGRGVRGRWHRAFRGMVGYVSGGRSMSEAMAAYPRVFKPLDVRVVETGELSGNLPRALELLSEWYGLTQRMMGRIRSGLILPAVIIHIAAFLLPLIYQLQAGGFLGDFDSRAYLFSVVRILLIYFWGPILVIGGIIRLTPAQGILRKILDMVVLAIPGLGGGMRYIAMSRYCRAFHMFVKAGVDGVESARRACEVTGNAVVAGWFRGVAESVKAGNSFSEGLSQRLPLMFREQWVVGEETGRLDEVTRRLADSTQEMGERRLREFSIWFPRILYFAMVLVLAALVLSLFVGHYENLLRGI
ncbi:MAG: hypothetical protein AMJ79_01735 [Phycisphaerae bacterium SM23_30]|nr:MAG: hypothetical protein AMJ79_01735 [Phycisphaerae bacterium SM23_30]